MRRRCCKIAKLLNLDVPSVDELFGFSTNKGQAETIVNIPIKKIFKFPNNPFTVRDDEKMKETVASIKNNGILLPAIVRKRNDDEYEMIVGGRKLRACEIAGKEEMPCIVR